MFERIKKWYNLRLWTEEMVKMAVDKGVITEIECNEILGVEDTVVEDIENTVEEASKELI